MAKRKPKKLPELSLLHDLFEYDFETGILTWKRTGKQAGWSDDRGYRVVAVNKIKYKVHRLIYFMFNRKDPGIKVIDHIDGDKANNRLTNLRAVKQSINSRNTWYVRALGHTPKPEKASYYFA